MNYCFHQILKALTLFMSLVFVSNTYSQNSIKINTDNDMLSSDADKDYTGGLSIQYTRETNNVIDINYELGFLLFTPLDIETKSIIKEDRPYASLIYLSSAKQREFKGGAIIQTITLGALGTAFPGDIQNEIHRSIKVATAKGWDNQISNGAEPTALYTIIYKKPFLMTKYFETSYDCQLNLGYLTNLSTAVSFRAGLINSPWFINGQSEGKIGGSTDVNNTKTSRKREIYLYGGLNAKAVGYNVFLQGQFKNNPHELSSSQLRRFIIEGWLGIKVDVTSNFSLGYNHRVQSSEAKAKLIDRGFNWGSLNATVIF